LTKITHFPILIYDPPILGNSLVILGIRSQVWGMVW
jgi:hypothetical protein